MAYKYTYQGYIPEKMSRAVGISLPISPKQAVEVCNHLKHKSVDAAKYILNRVLKKEAAIPYKRHSWNIAHKPGIAGGRYPAKASKEILALIESAEANALNKGLKDLYIVHMNAHRASPRRRAGRVVGESKIAHVEIVLEERKIEKKKSEKKAEK